MTLKRYLATGAVVAVCAGALASAQTPPPSDPPPAQPTATQPEPHAQMGHAQMGHHEKKSVTLVGCLYREADVPGRQPNIAERAGVLEDYILADATPASAAGEPGATGTSGVAEAGKMYKVEHLSDDRLREFVGKRVEVTGKIDADDDDVRRPAGTSGAPSPEPDRSLGPDAIELPEFEAESIKEASGTCPATPEAPRR
jgi:hypothetical protein